LHYHPTAPIAIKLIHAKGHQDRKSHTSLSTAAKLNIVAESIAAAMHATTPSQYHLFPGSGAYLSTNDNIVTSIYIAKIRDSASTEQLRQRLIEKNSGHKTNFN
jgi:hypothetical protein